MSVLSTGSPDPQDPGPTPEEPSSPAVALANRAAAGAGTDPDRSAGSPPPAPAAPHEGLVGEPDEPLGDDPRLGNVGRSAEGIPAEEQDDLLDEASDESFPASDPPSWSAAATVGDEQSDPSGTPGQHGLGRLVERRGEGEAAPSG